MTNLENGFRSLTRSEWWLAIRTGGVAFLFESHDSEELTHEQQVVSVKNLGRAMLALKAEIDSRPREALIEAAWQGIANYHVQGTTWGFDTEGVVELEQEKDLRMSLLTDDEKERAIFLANDWLDDNFDK